MRGLLIDPGRLRTELRIEAATPLPDGLGGHTEDWGEIATVFGLVEPIGAASRLGAGQALETVTHRVTLRWREGLRSGMRFAKGARRFAIVTVHDPDDSVRYLVCLTREEGA
jgi:SPP1 family predicted phage head-tail adaptor